jgi:hypothetical protein
MISTPSLPQKLKARECAAAVKGSPQSSSRCVPGHMRCSTPHLRSSLSRSPYPYRKKLRDPALNFISPVATRPALGRSTSRMSAWWYGMPKCSAQYFGEILIGRPVATAVSVIVWSMPLACMSISTLRPQVATPSNTVFQNW